MIHMCFIRLSQKTDRKVIVRLSPTFSRYVDKDRMQLEPVPFRIILNGFEFDILSQHKAQKL